MRIDRGGRRETLSEWSAPRMSLATAGALMGVSHTVAQIHEVAAMRKVLRGLLMLVAEDEAFAEAVGADFDARARALEMADAIKEVPKWPRRP